MSKKIFLAVTTLIAALGAQAAGPLPSNTPLVEDGTLFVNAADLDGYILRLPEGLRRDAYASYDRLANMVDAVFVTRSLAERARKEKLDQDPAVQRRLIQVQESYLTELYIQHLDRTLVTPDLEPRARELYKADPKAYTIPEHVRIQHILVNLWGRTREMGEERARRTLEEIRAAKEDFVTIAKRISDDLDKRRGDPDLGLNAATSFEPPIAAAVAKLKPGEVSEVIETPTGFHIVKLVERQEAKLTPFDAVKVKMIAAERERLIKERREKALSEVRESKNVVIHKGNVEAMVRPLDMKKAQPRPGGLQ